MATAETDRIIVDNAIRRHQARELFPDLVSARFGPSMDIASVLRPYTATRVPSGFSHPEEFDNGWLELNDSMFGFDNLDRHLRD
jgi:hypothetical protein